MIGKIIKGISGFYYVYVAESGIITCKAKGAFRKDKIKPLVGDDVRIDLISEETKEGNVVEILPRKSELIRPAVANVDQALVIFACTHPEPNLNLLDRFLVMMEAQNVPVVICFNKEDLGADISIEELTATYQSAGYQVLFTSAEKKQGIEELKNVLKGKTTTVAGPSGVGKSSLVNLLTEGQNMETGDVSEKIGRGRHTTRHSEILPLSDDTFIMDTPGFSSIFLPEIEALDLEKLFPEFREHTESCRFIGCAHYHEPDCAVKDALESGQIAQSRYDNYILMYEELASRKKY